MKPAIATLDSAIRAAGARTALFMTWSLLDPSSMFSMNMAVDRYYERQGQAVGALVAPVGRAWERALRQPGIVLHGPDGTHPRWPAPTSRPASSMRRWSGQSPVGLGDAGVAIDPEVARRLRDRLGHRGGAPAADAAAARRLPAAGRRRRQRGRLTDARARRRRGPTRARQRHHLRYWQIRRHSYFVGLDAPHLTVAVDAYRADWAAATAVPQFLVGKYHGFYLRQSGATLPAGSPPSTRRRPIPSTPTPACSPPAGTTSPSPTMARAPRCGSTAPRSRTRR
ncbi:MAG: hypothetical protein U1F43_37670 [Myxococcota bacterium]